MRPRTVATLLIAGAIVIGVWSDGAQHRPRVQVAPANAASFAPHIYISDVENNRIVRIDDMMGTGWTTFGSPGGGVGQFAGPHGISVDPAGRIYIADSGNERIVRIDDMTGAGWTTLSTRQGANYWGTPENVFVTAAGRIYVVEDVHMGDVVETQLLRMNDMTGAGETRLDRFRTSGGGFVPIYSPRGVFVNAAGLIYVAAAGDARIVRVNDMTGAGGIAFGTKGTGVRSFDYPVSVFVDGTGRIYVADRDNHRIVRVNDMTGAGWIALGMAGSGVKSFSSPSSLFVDPARRIYVVDSDNSRLVRVEDMKGSKWTTLGMKGSGVKQFRQPSAVFVR